MIEDNIPRKTEKPEQETHAITGFGSDYSKRRSQYDTSRKSYNNNASSIKKKIPKEKQYDIKSLIDLPDIRLKSLGSPDSRI